jgi:phosphatidylserine/phosphatidylglycerophosphate/cardiolipin synthase-like enzyme
MVSRAKTRHPPAFMTDVEPFPLAEPAEVRLVVQPGDSFLPIVDAIDSARERIRLTVYRLDCPAILDALLSARRRGVEVSVLISRQKRKWRRRNKALLQQLRRAGVAAVRPRPQPKLRIRDFHYKVMTVDGHTTLLFTFNPTKTNLHYCRDLGLVLRDPTFTQEVDRLLLADVRGTPYQPRLPYLAVSPGHARLKFRAFFESAERSIHILDSRLEDPEMLALLQRKAREGIEVRVLGSRRSARRRDDPTFFRAIDRFKLHAKAAVVDGDRFYVGSVNLRPKALDGRRELALFATDRAIGATMEKIFLRDWESRGRRSGRRRLSENTIQFPAVGQPQSYRGSNSDRFMLISRIDALCQLRFGPGSIRIGRADDNDLVIPHPSVSRYHAALHCRRGRVVIEDLGTANRTAVNQKWVRRRRRLRPGDVITIAQGDELRFLEA